MINLTQTVLCWTIFCMYLYLTPQTFCHPQQDLSIIACDPDLIPAFRVDLVTTGISVLPLSLFCLLAVPES
jgi:hypothetical protein